MLIIVVSPLAAGSEISTRLVTSGSTSFGNVSDSTRPMNFPFAAHVEVGDGPEAGPEARPLALTELLMPIARSALTAPSDAKLACFDSDHQ